MSDANDGWNSAFELLLHTPLLHELGLDNCAFPRGSAVQLFKSLSSLNSFTTLEIEKDDMDDYKLCPEDYQALCMLLSTSQTLTKLMVTYTLQPDSISKYLIDGLNNSICLEHLDISHSVLSHKDVELLSSMLQTSHTLNNFNIKDCDIESMGAHHIADALCINSSLETIVLDHNPLKDQGAIALARMLTRNQSLKELHLQSCLITQYGISCITEALNTNHSITKITLWGNSADKSLLLNDKRVAFGRCFGSLTQ